jgi:hypothetical protein
VLPDGCELVRGDTVAAGALVEFLNAQGRRHQLAMHWTIEHLAALAMHGLTPADFLVLRRGGELIGCAAVWDQRGFRQVVIHRYQGWLAATRPLANALSGWTGWPFLPAPGATLAHAFLSPIALDERFTFLLPTLVHASLQSAAQRGLDCLAVGFADGDPRTGEIAAAFRGRRYASQLYGVQWPGMNSGISRLDARPCLPELALL